MVHLRNLYNYHNPIYTFITTVHNTEESVEILKRKWEDQVRFERYFAIFKKQGGAVEMIYTNKKVWKENNIIILSTPTVNAELN